MLGSISSSRYQTTRARPRHRRNPHKTIHSCGRDAAPTDIKCPARRTRRSQSFSSMPYRRPRHRKRSAGGARRDRTDDLMLAKHALSQLSYGPYQKSGSPSSKASRSHLAPAEMPATQRLTVVGLGRLELPTSRLSSARSNQLSYKPLLATNDRRRAKSSHLWPIAGTGSSAKKEKRRRRCPANGLARPDIGRSLMFPRDPREIWNERTGSDTKVQAERSISAKGLP